VLASNDARAFAEGRDQLGGACDLVSDRRPCMAAQA